MITSCCRSSIHPVGLCKSQLNKITCCLQVSGFSYTVTLRGGSNGTGQQLLRLQEASVDSEYVLLLPASLAGVLLEVMERAMQCAVSGNNG